MVEEYQYILKNDVWEVVSKPKGMPMVTSRCIYKIKHVADGSVENYKARFIAQDFSQKESINYEETFAHVAMYTTIRFVISLAYVLGWNILQMDVKTTFLNDEVKEEVYIEHLEGFFIHGKDSHVCKLKKYLYGMKQDH